MEYPKNLETALKWNFQFWNTQPVSKFNEIISSDGAILPDNIELSQTAYKLPDEFEWIELNMIKIEDREKLSNFLNKYNYELSNKTSFKLHYNEEFLNWIYGKNNHKVIGIIIKNNNLLIGVISGKIIKMQINKNKIDMIETNYLCIHPQLRNKKMTHVLIKELVRQFNLLNYYYGIYATNNYLPSPILTTSQYFRPININKLVDTGFLKLQGTTELKSVKKAIKLPNLDNINPNFKKMKFEHLSKTYDIYKLYMSKYNCHRIYSIDEFKQIFLNNKFVTCYVVLDGDNVIDFASWYLTKLINNDKIINVANLFYYTSLIKTPYKLIKDLLIVSKSYNIDIFSAFDIMENNYILNELGFEKGNSNGILHYYFYNWKSLPFKNMQCAYLIP